MNDSKTQSSEKIFKEGQNKLFNYDLKAAIDLTESAINMDENLMEAYRFLAHCYFHFEQDHLKAHKLIDKSIEKEENEYLNYKIKGDIYYDERNFEAAVTNYKIAYSKLGTKNTNLLTQIGKCFYNMGNNDEAANYYQMAVELDPLCIDANRRLRILCVTNGKYKEAFELWKMDNIIDEYRKGTIIEKISNIEGALNNLSDNSNDNTSLVRLGDSYSSASLYDDAAIVYEKALKLNPSDPVITAKFKLIKDYLNVIEEYKEESVKIYNLISHGEKRNRKKHKQMLYDILLKLEVHFEEFKKLPKKITKRSWKKICKLYKKEFNLHIHDFFDKKVLYGTYASYVINNNPVALEYWNKKRKVQIIELGMDVEKEYSAWLFDYFDSQIGGWVGLNDSSSIYNLSDPYKSVNRHWMAVSDEKTSLENKRKEELDLNYDDYAIDEVFYSEGLSSRFISKFRKLIYEEALKKNENIKKYYFKRVYGIIYQTDMIAHEGQHTIDMQNVFTIIKTCFYTFKNKTNGIVAGYEYKAKLTELNYSENPYLSLGSIMNRDINSSSSHGKSNTLIYKRFVECIKDNPNDFDQIDTTKNILLQLDLLNIMQIRGLAKSIF